MKTVTDVPMMVTENSDLPASIDRRVRVVAGDGQGGEIRISSLRDHPYYVLLGEPGSGKSTVLRMEAEAAGQRSMTVRDFLGRRAKPAEASVHLDALDEYRAEGSSADRIQTLADALVTANVARWRISCRAEDWRLQADPAALGAAALCGTIRVVELLPLNAAESRHLLEHIGCPAPATFLEQAERLGAHGFVENPFSLELLYRATIGGSDWPRTRLTLFSSAIDRLAYERDPQRERLARSTRAQIIRAAGRLNLFLLATGAQYIWSSNQMPPAEDRGRYLHVEDTGLPAALVADTLDTALFRCESGHFVPMHRTIAEFSAAQNLGELLTGGTAAALPLARVRAMFCGVDGAPPTELRGLFGWLVTQLSCHGWSREVRTLIEADPITSLHYGDPALYTADEQRYLLQQLPAHVPHHGWPPGISLGGLAAEALVPEFRQILMQEKPESDLLLMVVEILERGRPLPGLHATYRALVADRDQPLWLRRRAFDLCMESASDPSAVPREYFEALQRGVGGKDYVLLQIHIAEAMSDTLSVRELQALLHEFECLPDDGTMGELSALFGALNDHVVAELFSIPCSDWRSECADVMRTAELDRELAQALAALILNGPARPAEQVWRWALHSRRFPYGPYGDTVVEAIAHRYGEDWHWRAALLEAAYTRRTGDWSMAHYDHDALTGGVNEAVLEATCGRLESGGPNENLLAALVYNVRGFQWPVLYWRCHGLLQAHTAPELMETLTSCPYRPGVRVQDAPVAPAATRAERREALEQSCDVLQAGADLELLEWGSGIYLNGGDDPPGAERLAAATSKRVAAAMVAGFRLLACRFQLAPALLQSHLARGKPVRPVLAGVVSWLDEDHAAFVPDLSLAVMVFFTGARVVNNYGQRHRLRRWAVRQITRSSAVGAHYLATLWSMHLAVGETHLPGLPLAFAEPQACEVFGRALADVVRAQPDMPPSTLAVAWQSLAACQKPADLGCLIAASLPLVTKAENRLIWRLVAMCLDPVAHAESILRDYPEADLVRYLDGSNPTGFGERLLIPDQHAACYFHALLVCTAGPRSAPASSTDGRAATHSAHSFAVRRAIRRLTSNPMAAAGHALRVFGKDPALAAWHTVLSAAVLDQAATHRDERFAYTSPAALAGLLSNGPPLNTADLYAVLATEVARLRDELQTDDLDPWAPFWNISVGKPPQPRMENLCRDHLLTRLRDRLKPYRITAAMAEAQHAGGTRADMLVISGANARVPVEVKRHMHPDVWTAAATQLQHYAAHLEAEGRGIYLVLWFGRQQLPARPDKRPMPATAAQFQQFLREELPESLRRTTEIFVLDVAPRRRGY